MWHGFVRWENLLLTAKVAKGMMPALFMSQDFLCWIIGTHFFNLRPELRAICTWLSHETLNMQSPAGLNAGVAKEVLRRATCFSKHLSFEPWNLNWTFQQKSLGISPVWCNIVCLYLPLSSLWENGNVKCPASAASGKTRCLHINSEILVLNLPWSIIVKEPLRILRSNCKLQLFPPVCLFFSFGCHQSPVRSFSFVHWKLCILRVPPGFHSSAAWQCNFLFNYSFLMWGGRGRTPVS